jgi:hypothetical protein
MGKRKALKVWWPGTELNRRRQPFQGWTLPFFFHSKPLCNQQAWSSDAIKNALGVVTIL